MDAAAASRIDAGFAVADDDSAVVVAGAAVSTAGAAADRDVPFADAPVACCGSFASNGFGTSGAAAPPAELGVADGAFGCWSTSGFATAAVAATSETDSGGANADAAAAAAAAAEVGVDAAAATAAADDGDVE